MSSFRTKAIIRERILYIILIAPFVKEGGGEYDTMINLIDLLVLVENLSALVRFSRNHSSIKDEDTIYD